MRLGSFFRLARAESKKGNSGRIRVGAVITKKGRLLSRGHNVLKSHPEVGTFSIHAEMLAILNCKKANLKNSEIIIYRETSDGAPALAKPCRFCMAFIINAGIKKVYYTKSEYPFYEVMKVR